MKLFQVGGLSLIIIGSILQLKFDNVLDILGDERWECGKGRGLVTDSKFEFQNSEKKDTMVYINYTLFRLKKFCMFCWLLYTKNNPSINIKLLRKVFSKMGFRIFTNARAQMTVSKACAGMEICRKLPLSLHFLYFLYCFNRIKW